MMSPLRITVHSWRAGGTGKLPSFQLTPTHMYFYGFKETRAVAMRDRRAGPQGTEADLKQFAITSLRFREATSGRLIRPLLQCECYRNREPARHHSCGRDWPSIETHRAQGLSIRKVGLK